MLSKLWEWLRQNHAPVTALAAMGTLLLTVLLVLLGVALALQENPHWINPVVNVLDNILPVSTSIIENSVPFLVMGLGTLVIGRAAMQLFGSTIRELRGGGARRTFMSLNVSITRCKELLLELERDYSDLTETVLLTRYVAVMTETATLAKELKNIDVSTPPLIDEDLKYLPSWVGILTILEVFARQGYYQEAIGTSRRLVQKVKSKNMKTP